MYETASHLAPVLAVEPVHVHKRCCKAEGDKERGHVPLLEEVLQHGREDDPEADSDEEHAGDHFWIGKRGIDLLDIHEYSDELLGGGGEKMFGGEGDQYPNLLSYSLWDSHSITRAMTCDPSPVTEYISRQFL